MNHLLKCYLVIAGIVVTTFATNVSASAVVIDFGTGLAGSGGTIDDVFGDGTHIIGTDINIGSLEAVGTSADGVYVVDALLHFDTNLNIISVDGTVAGLGINSSITLLSGSFDYWNYDAGAINVSFSGGGVDVKHDDLLTALDVSLGTQFEFLGFSLGYDFDGDGNAIAISTDIINTSAVPVPAAIWLFGTGLLGLIGIARR